MSDSGVNDATSAASTGSRPSATSAIVATACARCHDELISPPVRAERAATTEARERSWRETPAPRAPCHNQTANRETAPGTRTATAALLPCLAHLSSSRMRGRILETRRGCETPPPPAWPAEEAVA